MHPGVGPDRPAFHFDKIVYLADTNAEGNVYFARFFEWQGMAREELFRVAVPDHAELMASGIKLVTLNAWMSYKHEARLFDEVRISIRIINLTRTSLELRFAFLKKPAFDLLGIGGEKIAFLHNGKLIPLPPSVLTSAEKFMDQLSSADQDMPTELLRQPPRRTQLASQE
jgi:YbgC/YbaW family acyl-CoA thioester hydrolase